MAYVFNVAEDPYPISPEGHSGAGEAIARPMTLSVSLLLLFGKE